VTALHPLLDGLLGKPTTPQSIHGTVAGVEQVERTNAAEIEREIESHPSSSEWSAFGINAHSIVDGDRGSDDQSMLD
jgi:hypothetical protein